MRIPLGLRAAAGATQGGGGTGPTVLEYGIAAGNTVTFTSTPDSGTLILAFCCRNADDPGLPTDYTNIVLINGSNSRIRSAYKVSDGTETSITSASAVNVGYAFATVGSTLDVVGTSVSSTSSDAFVPGITPSADSLVFLHSGCNNNNTTTPLLDDTGWTNIIDTPTQLAVAREQAVWTKPGDGSATPLVTVDWSANVISGVQFSIK